MAHKENMRNTKPKAIRDGIYILLYEKTLDVWYKLCLTNIQIHIYMILIHANQIKQAFMK